MVRSDDPCGFLISVPSGSNANSISKPQRKTLECAAELLTGDKIVPPHLGGSEMFLKSSNLFISNHSRWSMATSLVLLFSCTMARAQKTTEINSGMIGNEQIQGHIFFPPGDKSSARPVIKLQSLSSPEITGVADQDGNFRFTHLRPDVYTVVVDGGETFERATDTVEIGSSGPVPAQGNPGQYAVPFVYHVQIYLKPKRSNASSAVSSQAFVNVP